MSQTETLMLLALGSAITLLFALLFGRAVWNIAMRLGARHNAKQIPLQMLELQADRDRLRAEHAMMSRKLELRLEDIKSRMTEQMAEVSRSRNRVQSLIQNLEDREATLVIRDREVAELKTQVEAQQQELEANAIALSRLTSEVESKDLEVSKLAQSVSQLSSNLREKNGMVGRLNEELQTSARINQPSASPSNGQVHIEDRLKRRIAELTSISAQMNDQQDDNIRSLNMPAIKPAPVEASNRQVDLNDRMSDAERESNAISLELKQLDAMLDQKLTTQEPEQLPAKQSAKANIISLAQRIRSLQGGE